MATAEPVLQSKADEAVATRQANTGGETQTAQHWKKFQASE